MDPWRQLCGIDPYHRPVSDPGLVGGRVYRIHAIGTRISCYRLEPSHRGRDGQLCYSPTPSPKVVDSWHDLADTDILEPLGYQGLISSVNMAWREAGLAWPGLNLDISTFERLGPCGCPTTQQVADTDAHPPNPPITSRSTISDSKIFGRGLLNMSCSGFNCHTSPSHLPSEIVIEVLENFATHDLRSFALSSTLCNDLAGQLLWQKFTITGNSAQEMDERCTALLKIPGGAGCITRLVIGPGRWTLNNDLLQRFGSIWPAVPRLAELILRNPPPSLNRDGTIRLFCDPEPLIRGLLSHAQSFRLRLFEYQGWLWPQSPLHKFLCAQPTIKELIGVDMFGTRPLAYSPHFLPSLEDLRCVRPVTALHLVRDRPIRSLLIEDQIFEDSELTLLAEALETCKCALTDVHLSVFQWPPRSQLERLAKLLHEVKVLSLDSCNFSSPFPMPLPALEQLECVQVQEYSPDPVRITGFASQFGPKVRRIFIYAGGDRHAWLKVDETQ